MSDKLEKKVADIIQELSEDDDVLQAIKDALDFGEIIQGAGDESPIHQAIITLVAEVIKNLEDDDDVAENIKDTIDFSSLAQETLQNEDVRKALTKLFTEVIKGIDSDDDDIAEKVKEWVSDENFIQKVISEDENAKKAIDDALKELIKEHVSNWSSNDFDLSDDLEITSEDVHKLASEDQEVQDAIKEKTKELVLEEIGSWDSDTEDIMSEIRDNTSPNPEYVKKLVADDPELIEKIRSKQEELIRSCVENLDFEGSDAKTVSMIQDLVKQNLPVQPMLEKLLSQDGELARKIRERTEAMVLKAVERLLGAPASGGDYLIDSLLMQSGAFKAAVEDAVSRMAWSGKIARMVETAVEKKIEDKDFLTGVIRKASDLKS